MTYRTYPFAPLTGVFFSANSSDNATISKLYTEFVRIHPALSDAGFSGFALTTSHDLQVFYIAMNVSQTQAKQAIDPFFTFARNLTSEGLNIGLESTTPFDSFYSWYSTLFQNFRQVGFDAEIASRLIPRDSIEENYKSIADAVFSGNGIIWSYVSDALPRIFRSLIVHFS